ncbi:alpha/beta hydrolase family protein [Streptomyces sp. S465]|uniref:alpha/beta hydrolase family protein n=1 Tax=Streptomyces sp. S465 TaxID=2979468 RepID=UPI0022A8ABF5|nr:lipase [Streptomyces sp. S465]WAP60330.1 lipase [Streptomyces sp. S465]
MSVTRRRLLARAAGSAVVGAVSVLGPAARASAAPAAADGPVRLELPRPTGPCALGVTELRLVDRTRRGPWWAGDAAGQFRELMVSVWYPADRAAAEDGPRAPYMRPGAAAVFGAGAANILEVDQGAIDWAGFGTHARVGVAAASGGGPRPVVLYSPGMYNERTLDTTAVEELASHGYVVVTVDPVHEAHAVEFPDGRVIEPAPGLGAIEADAERSRAALEVRVADIPFVLDQLAVLARGGNPDAGKRSLPQGLGKVLDLARTGMFGHSLGGMTTAEAMRVDRRIRAGANLDGPLGYDWTDPELLLPVARTGLDRPFLQMGAWLAVPSGRLPHTHEHSPSWRAMWRNSTDWKRDLWTEAAEHNSFTDYQTVLPGLAERLALPDGLTSRMIGTVGPARFAASRRAYLTAFFDQHLRGRHQPLLDGPSPLHPNVRFIG